MMKLRRRFQLNGLKRMSSYALAPLTWMLTVAPALAQSADGVGGLNPQAWLLN
ncbi:MAG: hypothetical protein HC929_17180, partial [Leptolyngbyaceae cyanobacterium SM2_5_2]|nr:hypothetical protein [Leptolyngbyaceae cyanobacterium SM2_5_2]